MKNVLLIVNILLVIAVATLFFLHFSKKTPGISTALTNTNTTAQPSNFKIAYFEMDSLDNTYAYAKEIREILRLKNERATEELKAIEGRYTRMWNENKAMQPTLTEEQMQKRNKALFDMEETFKATQQRLGADLQNEDFKYNQEIKTQIQDFLKDYCSKHGYAFVFARGLNSESDFIYFKNTTYDITADLVSALNEKYKSKKK